jgi:hypothetical protein
LPFTKRIAPPLEAGAFGVSFAGAALASVVVPPEAGAGVSAVLEQAAKKASMVTTQSKEVIFDNFI